MSAAIAKTFDVFLSVADIAEAFCQMDDDEQARFFVEVARIMEAYPGPAAGLLQRGAIARHLSTCECATELAREWLRDITSSLEESP